MTEANTGANTAKRKMPLHWKMAIGFGAGLLICGVTALILSLVGGKSRPGKDRPL